MTASLAIKTFVKTRLLKLQAEVKGLTSQNAFPILCDFFLSSSPSSCDSDNIQFSLDYKYCFHWIVSLCASDYDSDSSLIAREN